LSGKKLKTNKKLTIQMLRMILGAVTIILLGLALAIFIFARGLLVKELKEKSSHKVELASNYVNQWIETKKEIFKTISMRISYGDTGVKFNIRFFSKMLRKHRKSGIESIYMGYVDGRYSTGSGWIPPSTWNFKTRPWYISAKTAKHIIFTKPYIDDRTKKPMITIAGPIYKNGNLFSVMSIDVLIDDIIQTVDKLKIGNHSKVYVINSDGLFISHYDPKLVLKGNIKNTKDQPLFHEFKSKMSSKKSALFSNAKVFEKDDYVVISHIGETDWYLFFHLPFSEVNKPLKKLLWILVIGMVLSLLLLSMITFYLSGRIIKHILLLAKGAHGVAKGDYDIQLDIGTQDEIGYLSQCFNNMTEGLKDREFIKSTFGRYVSKDVMNDILDGNISLGGEKRELSILFSDIRGFTTLSEGLDPMDLVNLLNAYFTRMDKAISDSGGSINKYLGDGILAIFGAPKRLENSALSAVESAHEKLDQLVEFNKTQGSSLNIGIGIHTGEVIVGNIGSENRTEYTVIGESVNLSDKIESLTKVYGQKILITDPTAKKLPKEYILKAIDKITIKTSQPPMALFSPHKREELSDDQINEITIINKIMDTYYNGDFKKTIQLIDKDFPNPDIHLTLIKTRTIDLIKNPPNKWNGAADSL
jgi:class 3 adenylate cyclase